MSPDKNILSIDSDDDDNKDLLAFTEYLEEDTKRKKESTASFINQMGDKFLKEINQKKNLENKQKIKCIKYILKHTYKYDDEELELYSLKDLQDIYKEVKIQNQSVIIKFFRFIFNI